jgi:hypothetical protein
MRCAHRRVFGVAVLAGNLCAAPVPAWASDLTDSLKGEWSGSGQITLANGKSERIRCHGESRAVSENALEQSFHCATADKGFDFSTSMHFSEGRARGDWRAPDRSGTLSGPASLGSLRLQLLSPSGEGRLSATIGTCKQSINVTGWSKDLKSLSVHLRKDC